MVDPWRVVFTKRAQKDAKLISAAGLRVRAEQLLAILAVDPFQSLPTFAKSVGDLAGAYSRRINLQHRLMYEVLAGMRMWTHYE